MTICRNAAKKQTTTNAQNNIFFCLFAFGEIRLKARQMKNKERKRENYI